MLRLRRASRDASLSSTSRVLAHGDRGGDEQPALAHGLDRFARGGRRDGSRTRSGPLRSLRATLARFPSQAHFLPLEAIPDFHLAYQRTYIERDARLLADVSDWQQFGRFVRLASALTAQEVNRSQVGREIGVSPQTAERWLGILKATFQWFEVPAFSGNTVKRIASKAKGFVADTGLACWSLAISTPNAVPSHPAWGALFETAVYGEIRKAISSFRRGRSSTTGARGTVPRWTSSSSGTARSFPSR